MAGISRAGLQQNYYLTAYHVLHAFFTHPAAVYHG